MMRTTTPILSILIAVLLFLFFTEPQYAQVEKIKSEIADYNKTTETYNDFIKELKAKVTAKTSQSAFEIEKLSTLIPETIDDTQYLVDLEALAQKNNLLFGNVAVGNDDTVLTKANAAKNEEAGAKDELKTVDITFELVGKYEQFKSFLRDLESSLTIFEVTHISLKVTEGPFQQFAVTVRTYALPSK